jgi:GrpB-like predicted nucleotidyltransferase (UPF0157 family)
MADDLGLEQTEVRLAPHNPEWETLGLAECAQVVDRLGELALSVAHVGSTSVPELDAKPILDIAVAVDDRTPINDVIESLCDDGDYSYEGDKRNEGGLLFVRGDPLRTAHVHVVGIGSQAWRDYLRFRAILCHDAEARGRYQSAKRGLALAYPHDRVGYTRAKSGIVEELLGANQRRLYPHSE